MFPTSSAEDAGEERDMFLRSYTFVIYQDRPSDTLGPSVGSEAKAILCCNTTLSKEKDEARGYCGNWP